MYVELIGKFYYSFIVRNARSKTNVFYVDYLYPHKLQAHP